MSKLQKLAQRIATVYFSNRESVFKLQRSDILRFMGRDPIVNSDGFLDELNDELSSIGEDNNIWVYRSPVNSEHYIVLSRRAIAGMRMLNIAM